MINLLRARMFGLRREQLIGIASGALLGAVVSTLGRALGYTVTLSDGLLWGAVCGGILGAMPQFARSGAVLTRSSNSGWNLLVGLVGSLVFVVVIAVLAVLLTRLLF